MNEKTYDEMTYVERAEYHLNKYQYDLAAVLTTIALARALETANEIERVKLAQLNRIGSALELIAGKRGVIYTSDANKV